MPELPEVETVCRGLAMRMEGKRLTRVEQRRPDLRFPLPVGFAARLTGRRIVAIRRRAKYMIWELDDGNAVLAHLGMSGRMLIGEGRPAALETHDHLVFETEDGWCLRFNDARRGMSFPLFEKQSLDGHAAQRGQVDEVGVLGAVAEGARRYHHGVRQHEAALGVRGNVDGERGGGHSPIIGAADCRDEARVKAP